MIHKVMLLLMLSVGLSLSLVARCDVPGDVNGEIKTDALSQEAKALVKQFGGTLKPTLLGAIKSDGLTHAVTVCAVEAPKIAQDLSDQSGWQIKRVSLKPRNTLNAKADAWEENILRQFEQRQAKGESAQSLVYSEVVGQQFRFMKAQGVEPLCLNCHGQNVAPELKQALSHYYPDDQAIGYSLGQVRGAFSLIKDL